MSAETPKNPLYYWQGIAYALRRGEPIPDWCLVYLLECSEAISGLMFQVIAPDEPISFHAADGSRIPVEMKPSEAARKIAEALQIVVKARSYNAFKQLRADKQKIQDAALLEIAEHQGEWRLHGLFQGIPDELTEAADAHFSERFGTREHAEKAPERALETIQERRNLASPRRARDRVEEGKKLRNPNELPPSGG